MAMAARRILRVGDFFREHERSTTRRRPRAKGISDAERTTFGGCNLGWCVAACDESEKKRNSVLPSQGANPKARGHSQNQPKPCLKNPLQRKSKTSSSSS